MPGRPSLPWTAEMGARLRKLRGRRTVPQIAKLAAERLGSCDPNYLYKVEKGERSPGAELREALAAVLETSVTYVETGEQPALELAKPAQIGALIYEVSTKYPNASLAAGLAAQKGIAREAIEAVLASVHNSDQPDHPVMAWIDKMEKRAAILLEEADPATSQAREAHDRARADAQAAEARPRFTSTKRKKS